MFVPVFVSVCACPVVVVVVVCLFLSLVRCVFVCGCVGCYFCVRSGVCLCLSLCVL